MEIKYLIFSFLVGCICLVNAIDPKDSPVSTPDPLKVGVEAFPVIPDEPITSTTLSPSPTTTKPETTTKIPDDKTTSTATTTTSTSTTTTSTTTEKPKTTTTTTTTTKAPDTTTSTSTSTTTTTTSTTPSTTTTSTTTPAPSPTPAPTPIPDPDTGKWNSQCIKLNMAAQLNITYMTTDNKTNIAKYNIPSDAKVEDSICNTDDESIHLMWNSSLDTRKMDSFALYFLRNESTSTYYLYYISVDIGITSDIYVNATNQTIHLYYQVKNGTHAFHTPVDMSYHCTRKEVLNMRKSLNETDEIVGNLTISNLQWEAFQSGKQNITKFSMAKDCDASDTPDIVPIAVGVSLGCLILIILIAYLVARRQSNARGYTSF